MRFLRSLVPAVLLAAPLAVGGCVGPPVLERQVLGYDQVTSTLDQKLLLLNIARVSQEHPVHFTATSSIAATFDWTTSIGAGGTIAERSGTNLFNLDLNASASENPTFQIIPVTGSDFAQQVLEPLDEKEFKIVAFPQTGSLARVIRLMALGFDFLNEDGTRASYVENNPRRPESYKTFRRIAMHLDWLNRTRSLDLRPLIFDKVVVDGIKVPPRGQDVVNDQGVTWTQNPDGTYRVNRLTAGRLVIVNYDLAAMTDEERFELNEKLKMLPSNYIYVEVRRDGPGGDFPIRGTLRLRNVLQILQFVANGIERAPEFDVPPDPRTGKVLFNPPATLKINVSDGRPADGVAWIQYQDRYYSVADTFADRRTFALLGHLFQTAVGEVEDVGIPITISK